MPKKPIPGKRASKVDSAPKPLSGRRVPPPEMPGSGASVPVWGNRQSSVSADPKPLSGRKPSR